MKHNLDSRNFRLFSPDENNSNRWNNVLEVTDRCFLGDIYPEDDHLAPDVRVMEVLSEHQCQGWLEGYLRTGRHGFFSCYEAFIHIVDSMFNQHAKWLKACNHIPWRRPIASLNNLLSSHVWRQDQNGFSHQDPGFINHVVNQKAEIIRANLHVHGYREEGTTTTPFDMAACNQLDRFSLVSVVIDRVPGLKERAASAQQAIRERLIDHKHHIAEHGDDMPEVRDWRWGAQKRVSGRGNSTEADNV